MPQSKCHIHILQTNLWHFNDDLSLYCDHRLKTIRGTSTMIYLSSVQEIPQSQYTEQSVALQRWFICLPSKICHNHRLQNNPWHFNVGFLSTVQKCHNHSLQNNPWHFNDGLSLYFPRYATITGYRTIHGTPTIVHLSSVQDMQQSQTTEQSMALQRWFISLLSKICNNHSLQNNPWLFNDGLSPTTEQSMALQRWFISLLSKICNNHRLQNNP